MPRTPATVTPAPDPLADLREPDTTGPPAPPAENLEPEAVPLHTQAWHDRAEAETVAAWHADTTAPGFLHRGGVCGCRYLARTALRATLGPPVPEADPEGE